MIARGPSPLVMDAASYWRLGEVAANGDWLLKSEPIAYRTPGLPWLIATVRLTTTQPLLVLVLVQGTLWLATIALIAGMSAELTRDRRCVGIVLAASIAMVSSVTYVSAVLTETLFTFLLVSHLGAMMWFTRKPSVGLGVLVGITLSAAILTRPIAMLLWIPDGIYILLSWYWLPNERAVVCRKRGWVSVAVAAIVCGAALAPWLLRNQEMFGKAMLTEFVGRNLWIVTFQEGSGTGLSLPASSAAAQLKHEMGDAWPMLERDGSWRDTWTVSNALTSSGVSDPEADVLMKRVAIEALKSAPEEAARKAVRRCVNFWRTRATDLPQQLADLKVVPPGDGEQLDALYLGEQTWGVKVAPIDTALRFRAEQFTFHQHPGDASTVGGGTILLVWWRRTRAGAPVVRRRVDSTFGTVTGLLEIPAYRYRMVVEPLMLLVLGRGLLHPFSFVRLRTCANP